jgi:hypothetical protein
LTAVTVRIRCVAAVNSVSVPDFAFLWLFSFTADVGQHAAEKYHAHPQKYRSGGDDFGRNCRFIFCV